MRNKGKKNLTKEILAENINRQFGLTKSFSEKLINSLIFHLTNTVKTDKILKIKNFGTFRILNKKYRSFKRYAVYIFRSTNFIR